MDCPNILIVASETGKVKRGVRHRQKYVFYTKTDFAFYALFHLAMGEWLWYPLDTKETENFSLRGSILKSIPIT